MQEDDPAQGGWELPRRLLLVGSRPGFLASAPVLRRERVEVVATRTGQQALERVHDGTFHTVVVLEPLPDLPVGTFVQEIDASGAPRLGGVLVVLEEGDDPPTLPLGERLRVHCVDGEDLAGIEAALVEMLDLEPRHDVRLEIRLEVAMGAANARVPGLTGNVSRGGLLIRMGAPLRVGVRSRIVVELPDLQPPVEGEVEVVRHLPSAGDRRSAVAVRFVELSDEDAYRWRRYLEELRERPTLPAMHRGPG